jgi:site-specific recombinase XerD
VIPWIPKQPAQFSVLNSALFWFPFLSEPQQEKGKTSMLARFEPQPERLRRCLAGPLGPHLESFATLLSRQGYRPAVGWRKIWLAVELSRWLERRHVTLKDLEERHIVAFLQARWRRVSKRCGEATLMALLQHLRESHVIRVPAAEPLSDLGLVEQEYGCFLTQERGLMRSTVDLYLRLVRPFVAHHQQRGKLGLNKLGAKDVINFVLHNTARRGRWSTKSIITALRSFLGFSFQTGRTTTNLVAAVPTVPLSNLSDLPRFLQPEQVEKVLRCCDRRTKVGKRDYAILLLLARLGLRSGEVAKLTLDDIGWATAELLIRGKGARLDKLPLLQDVGAALADYLQNVRPRCSSRHVFIRSRAPQIGLLGASTMGSIVLRAVDRAQIHSHHRGAHIFRHSLATRMLGHGASLAQIGQVLRHQNVQTTEVYAKVDLIALRRLALPWRGGAL